MTMHVTPNIDDPGQPRAEGETSPQNPMSRARRWEGRLFGLLVLAAFLLYGIGSAQADHSVGLVLVVLNSVAVTIVGVIGFRLLRSSHQRAGTGYLVARIVEAVALAGGVVLVAFGDSADADTTGYLLAMIALGLGSVPFCQVLGLRRLLPRWLARWGIAGYTLLAGGALLELTTGRGVTVFFAAPGGLFEVTLGLYLLRRGFDSLDGVHSNRWA